jgi:hypothetical protein
MMFEKEKIWMSVYTGNIIQTDGRNELGGIEIFKPEDPKMMPVVGDLLYPIPSSINKGQFLVATQYTIETLNLTHGLDPIGYIITEPVFNRNLLLYQADVRLYCTVQPVYIPLGLDKTGINYITPSKDLRFIEESHIKGSTAFQVSSTETKHIALYDENESPIGFINNTLSGNGGSDSPFDLTRKIMFNNYRKDSEPTEREALAGLNGVTTFDSAHNLYPVNSDTAVDLGIPVIGALVGDWFGNIGVIETKTTSSPYIITVRTKSISDSADAFDLGHKIMYENYAHNSTITSRPSLAALNSTYTFNLTHPLYKLGDDSPVDLSTPVIGALVGDWYGNVAVIESIGLDQEGYVELIARTKATAVTLNEQVYYIDSVNGNDATGDGLKVTPFKTIKGAWNYLKDKKVVWNTPNTKIHLLLRGSNNSANPYVYTLTGTDGFETAIVYEAESNMNEPDITEFIYEHVKLQCIDDGDYALLGTNHGSLELYGLTVEMDLSLIDSEDYINKGSLLTANNIGFMNVSNCTFNAINDFTEPTLKDKISFCASMAGNVNFEDDNGFYGNVNLNSNVINLNNKLTNCFMLISNGKLSFNNLTINNCENAIINDDGEVFSSDAISGTVINKIPSNQDNCIGYYGKQSVQQLKMGYNGNKWLNPELGTGQLIVPTAGKGDTSSFPIGELQTGDQLSDSYFDLSGNITINSPATSYEYVLEAEETAQGGNMILDIYADIMNPTNFLIGISWGEVTPIPFDIKSRNSGWAADHETDYFKWEAATKRLYIKAAHPCHVKRIVENKLTGDTTNIKEVIIRTANIPWEEVGVVNPNSSTIVFDNDGKPELKNPQDDKEYVIKNHIFVEASSGGITAEVFYDSVVEAINERIPN